MKRSTLLFTALLLGAFLALAGLARADATIATGGAAGSYPPATGFAGVTVKGIETGFGVQLGSAGASRGQFCAILAGVSTLGLDQRIKIEGEVTAASQPAPNVTVLSGTAAIDMGDGLPPAEGVPFTATVAANADGLGTIGLVTALASLPDATMDLGNLTIR